MRKHSPCACVLEWESLEFFAVHAAVVLVNNRTIALRSNCLSTHIEKLLLDFFHREREEEEVREEIVK
jgi:hypothetical protein